MFKPIKTMYFLKFNNQMTHKKKYRLAQDSLVLIASVSNKCSGEASHTQVPVVS